MLQTTIKDKTIEKQLEAARQKLQSHHSPRLLRVISYLRICCSAMQKIYLHESKGKESEHRVSPYLSLLKSLSEYDTEWWKKCEITARGELKTDDPVIDKLLRPLEYLHHL